VTAADDSAEVGTTITEPTVNVGLDGTDASQQALLWAVDEAELRGAGICLLHGYSPPVMAGTATAAVMDAQEQWAAELITQASETIRSSAPALEITSQVEMLPAPMLLASRATASTVTVVGTRGKGQLSASLFGSVSMRVAGHAPGAVLVVRADQQVPERGSAQVIVLCTDGSEGSDKAAAFAFQEATLRGAEVLAIRSWDDQPLIQGLRAYPLEVDFDEVDRGEAAGLAEQLLPLIQAFPQVPVRQVIVRGRPVESILDHVTAHVNNASPILVVGSRGRGGVAGLLLGSTSQSLLAHSALPTVVVSS